MQITNTIPLVKARPHLRTIKRYIIRNLTFLPCYDWIVAIFTKFLLVIFKDAFFVRVPCTIIGSLMEVAWLTDSGSLVLRRRAIFDLIPKDVVVGMGLFNFAMSCDFERADGFCIFWEADGRNTKKLCSLSLRAWSNEIEVDWASRTSLGGEDGIMPANHRHTTQSNKVLFWIPTGST